ncbi:hypothetical protein FACS1894208_12760 [Clostridia bacterium]|nr:hypothetical protein FACS1894208_12760 [Clostridia bacterium]
MTLNRLKSVIFTHIAAYWGGAMVVWGSTNKVKPIAPLVVLRLGTVTRATQPVTQLINGIVFSAYPSETTLQVDLFTKGRLNEVEGSASGYYENTAESDLLNFVNYLDSTATIEWSSQNDVSVSLMSGVQDLSEVINDSQWQYRAMVEIRLTFTQWSAEYNGILIEASIVFGADGVPTGVNSASWRQTASGGGTDELATVKTGFFDEIPIITTEEELN